MATREDALKLLADIFHFIIKEVPNPADTNLLPGEIGINYATGVFYIKNPDTGEIISPNSLEDIATIMNRYNKATDEFNAELWCGYKIYTSLSSLSLTKGSETLLSIVTAMRDKSLFIDGIDGTNNVSEYPVDEGGMIKITKMNPSAITLEFLTRDNKRWMDFCDLTLETPFNGWNSNSGSGGGGGIPRDSRVVLQTDATEVLIGIADYNPLSDSIFVVANGASNLAFNQEYRVTGKGLNAKIIKNTPGVWTAGTIFDFRALVSGDIENPGIFSPAILTSEYTASSNGVTVVPIAIPVYNETTDYIEATYIPWGNPLIKGINFTVSMDWNYINLIGFSIAAGEKIFIKVYKNIKTDYSVDDGSHIAEKSISLAKLSQPVQDEINKISQHITDYVQLASKVTAIETNTSSVSYSTPVTVMQPIISLPSGVNKGQLSVACFGNTVNQIIKNGNFANGTTDWLTSASILSVSSNVLSATGNGSYSNGGAIQDTNVPVVTGKKVFVRALVRVLQSGATQVGLAVHGTTGGQIYAGIQSSPVANQWYPITGIITIDGTFTGNIRINPRMDWADSATQNGKVLEIKEVMAIDLTTHGLDALTLTDCNTRFPNWLKSGVVSTISTRVKSIGKNFISTKEAEWEQGNVDGSGNNLVYTTRIRTKNEFRVPSNTQCRYSVNSGYIAHSLNFYDNAGNFITQLASGSLASTFTTPINAYSAKAVIRNITDSATIIVSEIATIKPQIEIGTIATSFIDQSYTEAYLPSDIILRSLPNGTKDEVSLAQDGNWYKTIRNKEIISIATDINTLDTSPSTVDYVFIAKPIDFAFYNNTSVLGNVAFTFGNFTNGITANDINKHWVIGSSDSTTFFVLVVPKGTYANTAAAKAALTGLTLSYQLATPIPTPIEGMSQLIAEPNGTIIIDNAIKDTIAYGSNIAIGNTSLPIKSLERVTRITINPDNSRAETDIAITTCTVAGDGLSFTSTVLADGDIVEYVYQYDRNLSTLPSLTYSYPMNMKAQLESDAKMLSVVSQDITKLNDFAIAIVNKLDNKIENYLASSASDKFDYTNSPGRRYLIAGDREAGLFGFVSSAELISGTDLAAAVGLSVGTAQFSDTPWIKYMFKGEICFTPIKPLRYNLTWDNIYNAGAVFGTENEGTLPPMGRIGTGLTIDSTDNSINTTTLNFLGDKLVGTNYADTVAAVGDVIVLSGWVNGANNREATITSITNTKIIVSGAPLVTETGGRKSKLYKKTNAVTQNKKVTINSLQYKVRLFKGGTNDPQNSYLDSDRDSIGKENEWNWIILQLHEHAKLKNWNYPAYADSNLGDFGTYLTDADLITNTSFGAGSYAWCQEVRNDFPWYRVSRGGIEASFFSSYYSWFIASYYGWRPVLVVL